MADYILKADTYDKQSAKWRKLYALSDIELSHILMPKYDGCHAIIDTTSCAVWSRDRKPVHSMRTIAHMVRELVGPGLVVQGEAWIPGTEFPEISGEFRRHAESDRLQFVAFNSLTREEFDSGFSDMPFIDRFDRLFTLYNQRRWLRVGRAHHYNPGTYGSSEARALSFKETGRGYDGAILADPQAPWRAGRSRNGELIKVKPTLSLDLRVVAIHEAAGEKTGRPVYTLTVEYRGVLSEVGSGVPHTIPMDLISGSLVEVEAMGLTPEGKLREPRFKGIRYDKEEPDT